MTIPAPGGLAVDYDRYGQHCAWLIENGCRRVGPNGSLGEYSSLTDLTPDLVAGVLLRRPPGARDPDRCDIDVIAGADDVLDPSDPFPTGFVF